MNKIVGFNYGYLAKRKELISEAAKQSQKELYSIGCNWVCLAIVNYQDHFYSTHIYHDYLLSPSDRDIISFVNNAHSQGIKVCLKPMVNCKDNFWRAHIGFPDRNLDEQEQDGYWFKWFDSYKHYMLYYAELAEELQCEMLCIGCEMLGTEHRKYQWEYLIDEIRKIYGGKLIYCTNHDHEEDADWFDKLDYIGTSAYYPVGENGIDTENMLIEWNKVRERLNSIAERKKKKYIFMEIGCRSAATSSTMPWDFSRTNLPFNEREQALFYDTCLQTFLKEKNFAGVFWWDWSTTIYNTRQEAVQDTGFNVHLKETEQVLKKYLQEG